VIGTVMYVQSAFPNIVFALDLTKEGATDDLKHVPAQPPEARPIAVAIWSTAAWPTIQAASCSSSCFAGDLLGARCETGKQLWRVPNADYKTGSTMTMRRS